MQRNEWDIVGRTTARPDLVMKDFNRCFITNRLRGWNIVQDDRHEGKPHFVAVNIKTREEVDLDISVHKWPADETASRLCELGWPKRTGVFALDAHDINQLWRMKRHDVEADNN